ncbi:BCCT family transporter [Halomonas smyrnensis]|uniref:BCCT family transporter n=1 Tax=Halomonas smyrnensis TaxID=720605 RepID=UPI0012EAB1C9|nr:BCCT family transporter [Halomonas smyrnensis]
MRLRQNRLSEGMNKNVFFGSVVVAFFITMFALLSPEKASSTFTSLQSFIVEYGSWYYILMGGFIFLLCIYLGLSRYGDIKLGPDHSEPDYSRLTWFSMLFSAGLGIALVFYGVAEPIMHFLNPPGMVGGTAEAAKEALNITIFHWGLHAWAIYVAIALILSIYCYRHGLPLLVRSVLYPIIGDRIYGRIGDVVDIFAICGTLFGVATSMGFGAMQLNAGVHQNFSFIPDSLVVQGILIASLTLLATLSVISGLDKGIKLLSNINMSLAVLLMLFVLMAGNTVPVLGMLVQNIGEYLNSLMSKTFNLYAYEKTDWIGGWTVFYWAWWFAWCPFVGMFIARISRGRTIREFVFGVLFIPTGFVALWMSIFGNNAISLILNSGMTEIGEQVSNNVPVALFVFLEQLPFSQITPFIALFLIVVFFVTSADSGSLVMNILSCNGTDNPPTWMRVFWTFTVGLVAFVLLYAGGLNALQTMTIVSALPVSIILMFAIYGLFKVLFVDQLKQAVKQLPAPSPLVQMSDWRTRLRSIGHFPTEHEARCHLNEHVVDALSSVAEEIESSLKGHSVRTEVVHEEDYAELIIQNGGDYDFLYSVHLVERAIPVNVNSGDSGRASYFSNEVHLMEGGQDYDVMGLGEESLINDILNQYDKHVRFLRNIGEAFVGPEKTDASNAPRGYSKSMNKATGYHHPDKDVLVG